MEKPSIEQEVVDYTMDAIAMIILYFSSITITVGQNTEEMNHFSIWQRSQNILFPLPSKTGTFIVWLLTVTEAIYWE